MKTDCFAYRSEKKKSDGITWTREYCDALEERVCNKDRCPFYKPKDSVRMIIVHKQVQYEELK